MVAEVFDSRNRRGKLAGKRIAIKDSIMVAGVPMLSGSMELQGYVPQMDAIVVRRILEAGGEIVGKTHCEYFCLSGGSHTNAYTQVQNPHRAGYTPGGSSTGSAAAVAAGELPMAPGADQAGSIRLPASFSGIVGLKPTYGLVPYTGIAPIEPFIDHVGPMTTTVMDNALMLEVIAGADGYDPRQHNPVVSPYTQDIAEGIKGLRVGVFKEGFGHPNSEGDVDGKVRAAADALARLGANVEDVSVLAHLNGVAIWGVIALDGLTNLITAGNGFGIGRADVYPTDFMDHLYRAGSDRRGLPASIKGMLLTSTLATRQRGHALYGKGVNLARRLRAQYDAALSQFDVLLLPTTPMKATPIPNVSADIDLHWQRATEMLANTCAFDITHHPAISLPCGMSDGLPVGMMLVGLHFEESTLFRLAHVFESSQHWATR
ncbi:amidase [Paraburkholderia sp. 5N]|uniref:Amidase n=2 Tax=Paraburkholderia elongata TaxID=2675747 RepID=A0A972NXM5_9BURK|nr:amidase [Paraburkholderia elongata]